MCLASLNSALIRRFSLPESCDVYIETIKVTNFRCFKETMLKLRHPSESADAKDDPKLHYRNVNLLIGDNGAGKTSILKALALAVLGPVIGNSGYRPYYLVRRGARTSAAIVEAEALLHAQDVSRPRSKADTPITKTRFHARVLKRGDYESVLAKPPAGRGGQNIFLENSPAFFMVGYGATRRVDDPNTFSSTEMTKSRSVRYQRVAGLFEQQIALVPLTTWLLELKARNKARFSQVRTLLNALLPPEAGFTGRLIDRDFSFKIRGQEVPFSALSDGYRAYIGWIADLLHHLSVTCPSDLKLTQNRGLVLVDEIDLHLHPNWQRTIIEHISGTLPNLQFVFTTHSPLVAASLQKENIFVSKTDVDGVAMISQYDERIFGLSANQTLESSYFEVPSTRAEAFLNETRELASRTSLKDPSVAFSLMDQISGIRTTEPRNNQPGHRRAPNTTER